MAREARHGEDRRAGKNIYKRAQLRYERSPTFRRMKISFPTIQRQAAALAAITLFGPCLVGCGPIIERAPFRARPDTTVPADLLGPFDGQVLDADSEKPLPGALVHASWAFERGIGFVAPHGSAVHVSETDAGGRYRIPRLDLLPGGLSMRVARFTLIVYHRGYVAYRSDRQFSDFSLRRDFVQHSNQVRLVPWSPDMSHAKHVWFLGGGAPVATAAAWELPLASLELEPPLPLRPATRPTAAPVLNAAPLLTADEIRAVTGYKGLFDEKRLQDLARTTFYDSRHFQAVGKEQTHDVALRVWQLTPAAAEEHFERLRRELPQATVRNEVADRSFRSQEGDIRAVVFLARAPGVVVEVTCGAKQCPSADQVVELARRARAKLKLLTVTAPESQPTSAAPAGPKPGAAPTPPEAAPPEETKPEGPGEFRLRPPGVLKP